MACFFITAISGGIRQGLGALERERRISAFSPYRFLNERDLFSMDVHRQFQLLLYSRT